MDAELRRAELLRSAVLIAHRHGLRGLTHGRVADLAGCGKTTVYRWVSDRRALRRVVVEYAKAKGMHQLIAEAYQLGIN